MIFEYFRKMKIARLERQERETQRSLDSNKFGEYLDSCYLSPDKLSDWKNHLGSLDIGDSNVADIWVEKYNNMVDQALLDDFIDGDELEFLSEVIGSNVPEHIFDELDKSRGAELIRKSNILQKLANGEKPPVEISDQLPVILRKKEFVLWLENDTSYYKTGKKVEYVGGSSGVSIRLARGLWIRQSANKGRRLEKEIQKYVDDGFLAITNKNIHFIGEIKAAKIPLSKIINVNALADAVVIMRDGVSAKPEYFELSDPWFVSNVILKTIQGFVE